MNERTFHPGPDDRRPARRSKNYLAPAERQRLFWRFMPPALVVVLALGWVERTWFHRAEPPPVAQVDTTLRDPFAQGTAADAVLIQPEPEPFIATGLLGASASSLEKVRDDTVFRDDDREAWFQIWASLRSMDQQQLMKSATPPTGFAELYGQPRTFRGRLVRVRGTLHRLQRMQAPANEYDIDGYWQGWLEPAGGPPSPIVVYFRKLPPGMPEGLSIDERVEVVGYFFKRWAYAAKDTVRTAPLVMAIEPAWRPKTDTRPVLDAIGSVALITMAVLVLLTLMALWLANRGSQPPKPPPPIDIEKSLADVQLFSPSEALRTLSAAERPHASPGVSAEEDPPP